jgi:hypothetical protein
MTPSATLQSDIATLLAHDTGTLAAATAVNIHLAQNPFVPSPSLALASLTEANFTGYAALAGTSGNQNVYQDPLSGLQTVELIPPAGGWHFATTGVSNLPQTIYGWYVTDHLNAVLYGSGLLATPIPLSISGQAFDLPSLLFQFLNTSPQ